MFKELLNLPEDAGQLSTVEAVSSLIAETERIEAARAAKEANLMELRASTAELFGSALEGEGHDEEAVRAAMAAWLRDPETAAQAIAGCSSIEEAVEAANPYGCNQYGHREGHGEEGEPQNNVDQNSKSSDKKKEEDTEQEYKNNLRKAQEEQQRWRKSWLVSIKSGDEKGEKIAYKNLNKATDEVNKLKRIKYLKDTGSKSGARFESLEKLLSDDTVKTTHEPSIEELLVGDLVQAAGCNQYKHKPGCPQADSTEHSNDRSWADKSNYTKLKSTIETAKKARERYNESPSQENSAFLSTATARVKKYAESLISENKKIFDRLNKEGMSNQDDYELGERRPYSVLLDGQRSYSNFIGAANYLKNNASGERAEEALRDIETSAKELADLDAELTKILKSHKFSNE